MDKLKNLTILHNRKSERRIDNFFTENNNNPFERNRHYSLLSFFRGEGGDSDDIKKNLGYDLNRYNFLEMTVT